MFFFSLTDSCAKKQCEFFGICVSKNDGTAECVCPLCDKDNFKPICGDDGMTYANMCYLKKKACMSMKMIKAVRDEACGMPFAGFFVGIKG